ncbi:MAG: hypothetical protein WBV39_15180, partial [Rudaea sp.]
PCHVDARQFGAELYRFLPAQTRSYTMRAGLILPSVIDPAGPAAIGACERWNHRVKARRCDVSLP